MQKEKGGDDKKDDDDDDDDDIPDLVAGETFDKEAKKNEDDKEVE